MRSSIVERASALPSSRLRRAMRTAASVAPFVVADALSIPLCPFALFSGKPCPGCGITRAAHALFQGDLQRAAELNPVAIAVVPISALMITIAIVSYVQDGRTRMNHPLAKAAAFSTMTALLVVWVLRWFGAFGGPVPV